MLLEPPLERMKYMKKMFLIPLLTILTLSLTACALINDFAVFERTLDRGIQTADQLDRIDAQDLSESGVNGLDFAIEDEILQMAFDSFAVLPIVGEIRALHQSIRVTHAEIVLIREDNRVQREELRVAIEAFREAGFRLTEEDKAILKTYVEELQLRRGGLIATNGEAFRKMKSLRGQYRLENAETIQTTLEEVLGLLEGRKAHFVRIGEIIAAVHTMAQSYEVNASE